MYLYDEFSSGLVKSNDGRLIPIQAALPNSLPNISGELEKLQTEIANKEKAIKDLEAKLKNGSSNDTDWVTLGLVGAGGLVIGIVIAK